MAARKVYACTACQPLQPGTVLAPARLKALGASAPTQVPSTALAPTLSPPQDLSSPRLFSRLVKGNSGSLASLLSTLCKLSQPHCSIIAC